MSPPRSCLIPSPPPTAATPPPKHLIPPPFNSPLRRLISTVSRRDALALSLLSLLHRPPPATAFSIGISGPKDWLREQKKKSANFLLAPIDGSRNILRAAYLLLMKEDSEYGEKDVEEVQGMLRSASRDCVPKERNSFVNFQAKTGVEVCTFQLVLKNAASLLDNDDPIKLEAEASLRDLVRNDLMDANEVADKLARMDEVADKLAMLSMSFTSLNVVANEIDTQVPSSRQKVAAALMDSIASLNNFEQGVKDCLEI